MTEGEYLAGGVNQVLRTGGTVHRPAGAWTPAVHGLLRHLRSRGFTGAPAVIGMDAEGREELSFIPGVTGDYPMSEAARSTEALVTAARLLRGYHDATAGYAAQQPDGWMLPSHSPAEVICHGDFAAYNCVLDGSRTVGIIDFDTAHPGPRIWDIGYAVYRWAPFGGPGNPDAFGSVTEQARRARLFCDAYGLETSQRRLLVDTAADTLRALVDMMRREAAGGNASFQRHVDEGHDLLYLRDIVYFLAVRESIEAVVLADRAAAGVARGGGRDAGVPSPV